jgi:hypothetical protein
MPSSSPSSIAFNTAPELRVSCQYFKEFPPTNYLTLSDIMSTNSTNYTYNKMGIYVTVSAKKSTGTWGLLSNTASMYRTMFPNAATGLLSYDPSNKSCALLWNQISHTNIYIGRGMIM